MFPAASLVKCSVSSCFNVSPVIPAARLTTMVVATTRSPQCLAHSTSGTMDIPTTSAPRIRKALISAGVSNEGPEEAR